MLHWAQGDLAGAESLLNQALDINRGNLELAAAAQAERQQLAMAQALRFDLDAHLSLTQDAKRSGEPTYRQVLAWKGAVFARQRWSRNQRRLLQADRQPEVARLVSDLQDTITRLATLALTTPDPKQLEAWHRQVADLTAQGGPGGGTVPAQRRVPPRAGPGADDAGAGAGRLAARHRPDRLPGVHPLQPIPQGKEKWKWERRLAAFVVRPDRPLVPLDLGPLGPIAAAVDQWLPRLRRGVTAPGPDDPAVTLRRRVWQPLAAHLEGVRTVLVSPDGALAQLPLGALPGQQPGTYLIEEVALAVVPVPQALPALLAEWGKPPVQGPPAAGPGAALLLVGDVDYGARPGSADARGTSRAAAADARARSFAVFGRLAATGGEITALRALFQRRYPTAPVLDLRGAQATEGTIREQAGHHRWIHLATHGFFAPRRCAPP